MADLDTVINLREALRLRTMPALTRWNRLEGRPRAHQFDRALRAEMADPLWMLSRQWQMGEFEGDDAGSPVLARICSRTSALDRFQAGTAAPEPLSTALPLETQVERRPIAWQAGALRLALDLRLMLGRRWQKLLASARSRGELGQDYGPAYLDKYKVVAPDAADLGEAGICAHAEAWRQFNAAADRAIDGYRLLAYLDADLSHRASDGVGASAGDAPVLDALAQRWRDWLYQLIEQPGSPGNPAWQSGKLEYQFGCSGPLGGGRDLVLRADEYYQGHLDWYAMEQSAASSLGGAASQAPAAALAAHTFIPNGLVFGGMPATRWWSFEDRRTNFGEVRPDKVDLGKLLLLEFGLVYANDWFMFPMTLPVATATEIKGIALTNVFGERIWIEPVRQPQGNWQRWDMYQMTRPAGAEPRLVLLPVAPKVIESKPLEEVALVRDEMANMVWGVERRVPLPTGVGKPGGESALEYRRYLERLAGVVPLAHPPKAPIRYEVMTTVPENWIPFVPVHVQGNSREIRLQRAAMPRILNNLPPELAKVRPRTALLREGLDRVGPPPPGATWYFIDEEEVPRAGAVVTQTFQRTRWHGGRTVVWLGAGKSTGRGEGSSGLAFDRVAPAEGA